MRDRQRSKRGYWIAGVVTILGATGGIVWGTLTFIDFRDRADALRRTSLPGVVELQLSEGQDQVVYFEGDDSVEAPNIRVTVEGPNGRVDVEGYEVNLEYDSEDGGTGKAVATFRASAAGAYVVRAEAPTGGPGSFAVGQSITDSFLPHIIGAVVVILASIGLAILIVAITNDRRYTRQKG